MKHYLVNYWKDFGNTYTLAWTEAGSAEEQAAIENGWERITRKEAIRLCVEERERRRTDEAFSGYASEKVFPLSLIQNDDFDGDIEWWMNTNDGYIYC